MLDESQSSFLHEIKKTLRLICHRCINFFCASLTGTVGLLWKRTVTAASCAAVVEAGLYCIAPPKSRITSRRKKCTLCVVVGKAEVKSRWMEKILLGFCSPMSLRHVRVVRTARSSLRDAFFGRVVFLAVLRYGPTSTVDADLSDGYYAEMVAQERKKRAAWPAASGT